MSSRETTATHQDPEPLALATGIPVSCNPAVFTNEQRSAHLALSVDAIVRWPARRQELADGFLFEYDGEEERFLTLARWVAAEHQCCPWAAYSVEMGPFDRKPGTVRVRVRASNEGRAFLKTCYEYVEKLGNEEPPDHLFRAAEQVTRDEVVKEIARRET